MFVAHSVFQAMDRSFTWSRSWSVFPWSLLVPFHQLAFGLQSTKALLMGHVASISGPIMCIRILDGAINLFATIVTSPESGRDIRKLLQGQSRVPLSSRTERRTGVFIKPESPHWQCLTICHLNANYLLAAFLLYPLTIWLPIHTHNGFEWVLSAR